MTGGRDPSWEERVDLYVDGALPPEEARALEARLAEDADLRLVLDLSREAKAAVAAVPALAPREGDLERVLATLRAAPAPATADQAERGFAPEGPSGGRKATILSARRPRPIARFLAAASVVGAFLGLLSVLVAPAGASLAFAPRIFARYDYRRPARTAWAEAWLPARAQTPPPADLAGVLGADGVTLTAKARARLLEAGIIWRPAARPDAARPMPALATVDAAAALLGAALSATAADLEREAMGPDLRRLLDELHAGLLRDQGRARSSAREGFALAIDVVEAGQALLEEGTGDEAPPKRLLPGEGKPLPEPLRLRAPHVEAEVALVVAGEGTAPSPITGETEDYSAFRRTMRAGPALAVAWLSRPRLALDRPRDAAAALAIAHALCAPSASGGRERPVDLLERIRARHAFFHGAPVDWPPERLLPWLRERTGARLALSEVVPDGPLADAMAKLPPPSIEGPMGPRAAFSLLGWRWDAASLAAARLTGPDRLLGSGLDLLAVEGFPGAREMMARLSGAEPADLDRRLPMIAREIEEGAGEADLGRLMALARKEIGRSAWRAAGTEPGRDRALSQALATLDAHLLQPVPGAAAAPGAEGTGGALPVAIEPQPLVFGRLAAIARAVSDALREGEEFPSRSEHVSALASIADLLDGVAGGDLEAARRLARAAWAPLASVRTIDVVLGASGRTTLQQRITLGPTETLALVPRPGAPGSFMLARGPGLASFELAAEKPLDPAGREASGDRLPVPPWLRGWREP